MVDVARRVGRVHQRARHRRGDRPGRHGAGRARGGQRPQRSCSTAKGDDVNQSGEGSSRSARRGRDRRRGSRSRRGDVGHHVRLNGELLAWRQVAGLPSVVTTSSLPSAVRSCGPTRRSRRIDVPSSGYSVADRHHRIVERLGSTISRRSATSTGFVGQPTAHHVVAGAHQLDAGATEVGVEVARAQLQGLAGRQADEVEEQRRGDAGIAGVAARRGATTHAASGRSLAAAAATIGSTGSCSAIQRRECGARPTVAKGAGQLVGTELVEQLEGGSDRTDAAERLEGGQRAEQLRLRLGVGVAAGGEPGLRLRSARMELQRQRLGGGEHLQEVRQRSRDRRRAGGRRSAWQDRADGCPTTALPMDDRRAARRAGAGMNAVVAPRRSAARPHGSAPPRQPTELGMGREAREPEPPHYRPTTVNRLLLLVPSLLLLPLAACGGDDDDAGRQPSTAAPRPTPRCRRVPAGGSYDVRHWSRRRRRRGDSGGRVRAARSDLRPHTDGADQRRRTGAVDRTNHRHLPRPTAAQPAAALDHATGHRGGACHGRRARLARRGGVPAQRPDRRCAGHGGHDHRRRHDVPPPGLRPRLRHRVGSGPRQPRRVRRRDDRPADDRR